MLMTSVVMFILSSKVHLLLCLKHNIHYRDNVVYRYEMSFCYRNYQDIGFFYYRTALPQGLLN